ncbi:hypothetical protein AHiyo8_10850 [Arthrobacter sp. Hiyo8]|nr:hypothetical protein AHiyo8_10850 [Arthrobacter sp. Hiyo8]
MTTMLVLSTPAIVVDRDTVQVGRATIQREFVGAVTAYRKDEATAERGTRLHGLAFLCLRGWIDPVVRIEITDPADRTPYWLTSTRRPKNFWQRCPRSLREASFRIPCNKGARPSPAQSGSGV